MRKKIGLQTLLITVCLSVVTGLAAQEKTARYCNNRFGYCLSYPAALLTPAPESQNGDGRRFADRSSKDRLVVYGSGDWNFNDEGTSVPLVTVYRQELKGGRFPDEGANRVITYKAPGKTSFVISGTEKGEIFYLKVIKRGDAFCFAYLHYPADLAKQYNPVAALIAKSFR